LAERAARLEVSLEASVKQCGAEFGGKLAALESSVAQSSLRLEAALADGCQRGAASVEECRQRIGTLAAGLDDCRQSLAAGLLECREAGKAHAAYPSDAEDLRELLIAHYGVTGSSVAEEILSRWPRVLSEFVRVFPRDFVKALSAGDKGAGALEAFKSWMPGDHDQRPGSLLVQRSKDLAAPKAPKAP